MTTFTINDLIDIEQDRVNHPKRYLVVNPLARRVSAIYYLLLVIIYCILTAETLPVALSWASLTGLVIFISYSIIKMNIPIIKNLYIATAVPTLCYANFISIGIKSSTYIYISAFVFIFSREVLMDVPDIGGDRDSIAQRLGWRSSLKFVLALDVLAATILLPHLWPFHPMLGLAGFAFPILLLVCLRPFSADQAFSRCARISSFLPLLYCVYLTKAS